MTKTRKPHCVVHRKLLASKSLPSEMDCVHQSVIKVVYYIKGKALETHNFYVNILYNTEVKASNFCVGDKSWGEIFN